jgi:hypothetical protein
LFETRLSFTVVSMIGCLSCLCQRLVMMWPPSWQAV